MSVFDEWLDNKWQLLLGAGRDDWDDEDMKIAYNKGMERAAEIVEKKERVRFDNVGNPMIKEFTPWYAEAIRKEIETISISDIRKEIEK